MVDYLLECLVSCPLNRSDEGGDLVLRNLSRQPFFFHVFTINLSVPGRAEIFHNAPRFLQTGKEFKQLPN